MPADENGFTQDRLDSWKEIAAYLRKGVRTVQRWEQTEGLPVRRLGQDRNGSVFAWKAELDAWWEQKSEQGATSRHAEKENSQAAWGGSGSAGRDLPGSRRPETDEKEHSGEVIPVPRAPRRYLTAGVIAATCAAVVAWSLRPARSVPYHPVPLTSEHGWELQPSFSPDGRQIAYASSTSSGSFIAVKSIGADAAVRLTTASRPERNPAWSPDGRLIAFLRRADAPETATVMLIPLGGGMESRLTDVKGAGKLLWSPDSRWLLTTESGSKSVVITAIAVPSGERHTLTDPFDFQPCGFGITPDLQRLVVCRGGPGPSSVLAVPLGPGLEPRGRPVTLIAGQSIREMVLAPDGSQIFYTEGIWEEGVAIWHRRLSAGATPELIHGTSDRYLNLALSADGHRLAFAASDRYREALWMIRPGDLSPHPVPLVSSTHSDMNPDYSPDGRHIAFHSTRTGASDIWIVDRDGSHARRLTYTNARTTATPRWSPDGEWIAFESNENGQSEVYVVRSSGGPAQRLTDNPAVDAIPAWSHDGKTIYFCSNWTGRFEIWKMPAGGGKPEQVTQTGGFAARPSPDGKYLYYSETRIAGPVWRMDLAAKTRELIIDDIRGLFYAVTNDSVYYPARGAVARWDAVTRQVSKVCASPGPIGYGLAVSPGGSELLFAVAESEETDLYLIDGLH